MTQKKSYHHGDLLQALIDAALDLVAEKDVTNVSLREIARRVGVSHTAPYRHFADKEALLAAVAQEGFQRFKQAIEAAIQSVADPGEQLEMGCLTYIRYAVKHPSRYRIMFGAYGANPEKADRAMVETAKQAYLPLADAIARGQTLGIFRAGNPEQMAQTVWALMHGLAMLLIGGQLADSDDGEAIASLSRSTLHLLVEGLGQRMS
jgi:AcrR family transcriptional regulator